ncbi:hypothetical protein ACF1AY_11005 [Streptomyces sp. NPDC014776]
MHELGEASLDPIDLLLTSALNGLAARRRWCAPLVRAGRRRAGGEYPADRRRETAETVRCR